MTLYRGSDSMDDGIRHEISNKNDISRGFQEFWTTKEKDYWKPITLRAPILGSFIAISVGMIIVLELLSHIAGVSSDFTGSGAIAFAGADGNVSNSTNFAYLYFPSVIAVCYSILWSWVDLDSKRLEPWFQLSKEEGASAEDSLMLHYNFDFLAVAPVCAARRRHWSVFFAGITTLIILWIITPLQSAIFGSGVVIRSQAIQMATTAAIQPIETQIDILNANFLMNAYGISWLGEKLPEFTTKSYAIRPFAPLTQDRETSFTQTWSSPANAYSTNISCTPAKITQHGNQQYDFDNGRGCFVPDIYFFQSSDAGFYSYVMMYVGYFDDAHIDWALVNPNCSHEFSNNFLAIWARSTSLMPNGTYGEMTALFCETSYAVRTITVQVNASDHSIISDNFDSTESQPLGEGILNTTNFEYVIGTGFSPINQITDYPNTIFVEQYPRMKDYNVTWPTNNMVGYGVAAALTSMDHFGDPALLESAYRKAHQLLFSVAFNKLLSDSAQTDSQELHDGQLTERINGIVLVRVFSIIVECFLTLTCIMTASLWYIMSRRSSQLVRDPDSISQYMSTVSHSHELKHLFRDMGKITREQFSTRLQINTFRLRGKFEGTKPSMFLEVLPSEGVTGQKEAFDEPSFPKSESVIEQTYPRELRLSTALFFISTLAVSIIVLLYLNILMRKTNGLQLPASSRIIRQILENYLPTILATAIEPLWVALNRLLCILKPFDELRKGNSPPEKSIDANYTSLPPQLVFRRAFKSRHFLLAAVCVISLLANILAVSLSGLFDEALTTNTTEVASTYKLSSTFNGAPFEYFLGEVGYSDHFYVTLANVSSGTGLPPWTSRDFFFTPFNLLNWTSDPAQFSAVTRGFGVETVCNVLSESSAGDRLVFSISDNATSAHFSVLQKAPNDTTITCAPVPGYVDWPAPGRGANAFEAAVGMYTFSPPNSTQIDDSQKCEGMLVTGWARLGPSSKPSNNYQSSSIAQNRSLDSVFLSCRPTLKTALFNVTVDGAGNVLSTKQEAPFDTSLEPFFKGTAASNITNPEEFSAGQIRNLYVQANNLITQSVPVMQWHNETISLDWLTYLLKFANNLTSITSPSAPIPSPTILIPAVESLYNQMFATLLSLNQQVFNPIDPGSALVTVTIATPITRIFMSQTMFLTTLIILSLNLIVAILYYVYRPKCFLPMMPTTIASIVGLVVATRAVEDYKKDAGIVSLRDPQTTFASATALEEESQTQRSSLRFGYGRFIGTDGTTRVGIERHPWVVPLQIKNPYAPRKRKTWFSAVGLRIGKKDEKEIRNWI